MEEKVIENQTNEKNSNMKYKKRRFTYKKKYCFFCAHKDVKIDYKDVDLLKRFVSESYKITPRRFTGTCAKHQRKLANEIKKARVMALLPFIEE